MRSGIQTRVPSLSLSTSGRSLSWTANGVAIPSESSPVKLFKRLFVDGSASEVKKEIEKIRRGQSILDTVSGRAKQMQRSLGMPDQIKMDEYLLSVRDLETRLQQSQSWVQRPKPVIDRDAPEDIGDKAMAIEKQRLMNDMIVMALQTDSTRVVTLSLGGLNSPPKIPGVQSDWHGLSHHGKDPEKIEELTLIERAEFNVFNEFLNKLKAIGRRRRVTAGPHHRFVWIESWQCECPRLAQSADHCCRWRVSTWPIRRPRLGFEHAAGKCIRRNRAANGSGNRSVWEFHRSRGAWTPSMI